jgi:hypothetical protein
MMAVLVLAAAGAAAFGVLLWGIGRAVTAVAATVPPGSAGRDRQYLAGRLDGVRITSLLAGDGEFLVTLAVPGAGGSLDTMYRITAAEWPPERVMRWYYGGALLRGYLSGDGALMLADPVLGGNAGCEPFMTIPRLAREPAGSPDQLPTDDK